MHDSVAALAHKLGTHVDDLIDSGDIAIMLPDNEQEAVGYLTDTLPGQADNVFIVLMADGTKVRVTCEQVG